MTQFVTTVNAPTCAVELEVDALEVADELVLVATGGNDVPDEDDVVLVGGGGTACSDAVVCLCMA